MGESGGGGGQERQRQRRRAFLAAAEEKKCEGGGSASRRKTTFGHAPRLEMRDPKTLTVSSPRHTLSLALLRTAGLTLLKSMLTPPPARPPACLKYKRMDIKKAREHIDALLSGVAESRPGKRQSGH